MVLAGTGNWGKCLDLPVRLLTMFHAFLLEHKKTMIQTAVDHRVLRFLSSMVSRVIVTLLEWLLSRGCKKFWCSISHSASQQSV